MDIKEIKDLVRQAKEAQMSADPRVSTLEAAVELTKMQYEKAVEVLSELSIYPSAETKMAMLQVLSKNYSAITIANAMPE